MHYDYTSLSNSTPQPQTLEIYEAETPDLSSTTLVHSNPAHQKQKAPISNVQIKIWTREWLKQLEDGGNYPYKDRKVFHVRQSDGSVNRVEVPISLELRYASRQPTDRMRPIKSSHSIPKNLQKKRKKLKYRIIPVLAEFPEGDLHYAVFTSGPLCPLSALGKTIRILFEKIGDLFRHCKKSYPMELLIIVVEPKPAEDDLGNPVFDSEGEMLFHVHANVIFRLTGPMRGKWAAFWTRCRGCLGTHVRDCGPVNSVPKLVSYILKLWDFQPIIDDHAVVEFHNALYRNPLVKTYGTLNETLGNERKSRTPHRPPAGASRRPGPKIYPAIPTEIYLGSKDRRMPDGETERVDIFMVPEAHHPGFASSVVCSPYFNKYTPLTPTLLEMKTLLPELSVPSGAFNLSKTQSGPPDPSPRIGRRVNLRQPRLPNETARTETFVSSRARTLRK